MKKILSPYTKGNFTLKNHLVMAPMTRCRAINNLPNELMAEYYAQRSGAGLIVSEGISPAAEGLGYARIPGLFTNDQVEAWKKTTSAVHKNGSKIFAQLMHTGRIAHTDNLADGVKIIGSSDIKAAGQMYTDKSGMQDHSQPTALTTEEVRSTIEQYVIASKNAITAGFDGVEFHGAHGYLMEQFLNPNVNNRADEYGGSVKNRTQFVIETVEKTASEIGKEKVGIRISPFSTYNDMQEYSAQEVSETYILLAEEFEKIGIAYIHISANPSTPIELYNTIREKFTGTIILCNALTPESAEKALEEGLADIVAFGRSYLTTPDLDKRIEINAELNQPNFNTFYTADAIGYTDYPTL